MPRREDMTLHIGEQGYLVGRPNEQSITRFSWPVEHGGLSTNSKSTVEFKDRVVGVIRRELKHTGQLGGVAFVMTASTPVLRLVRSSHIML